MNAASLGEGIADIYVNCVNREDFVAKLRAVYPSAAGDANVLFALCNAVWHGGYHEGLEECEE